MKKKPIIITTAVVLTLIIVAAIVVAVLFSPPKTLSRDDFALTITFSEQTGTVNATLKNDTSKILKISRGPTFIDYFVAKEDEEFDFDVNKVYVLVEDSLNFSEKDTFTLPSLENGKYKITAQCSFRCPSANADVCVRSNVLYFEIDN